MEKKFIVNRQGKDFVLYAGLVDQAHKEGLVRITTKLVQSPTDENGHLAICWAEVQTDKGVFSGIGDASPSNVGRMIAAHTVRMAETRAKARALRDAINVAMAAFEELASDDDSDAGATRVETPRTQNQQRVEPAPNMRVLPPTGAPSGDGDDQPKQQQIDRIFKLQAACGRPTGLPANVITSGQAAELIRELVGIFNSQVCNTQKRG